MREITPLPTTTCDKYKLIHEAKKLLSKGINVIAVDGHKKAAFAWKAFTEDLIAETTLINQINSEKAEGIAVICGGVSGGLEVIDFDLKYDISGDLMARYNSLIPEELLKKLYIVRTKSNGFHYYYRCEVVEGNKKLAARPATPEELKDTPHLKQLVLIETRGNNGYVVAPPSDGYHIEQANEISVITIEERETLLEAARSFHDVHTEERAKFTTTGAAFVVSPFDDYNQKADAVSLLCRHGWSVVSEDNKRVYLKRAGNTSAKTSGNYHKDKNLFYVWTSSTQFYPEKAYSPAAIYSILKHSGDYSAASKQLIKEGYGTKRTPQALEEAAKKSYDFDLKFWDVETNKKGDSKIVIRLTDLSDYINKKGGFTGYKYNDESEKILVQLKDGMVEEVGLYDIKQFLKNDILSISGNIDLGLTPNELLEMVYRDYLPFLSNSFMDLLTVTPLKFLKDTKDAAYFPFRNGVIKVTEAGSEFQTYGQCDGVIWKNQMIDFIIDPYTDLRDLDFNNIDFCKFVKKTAGDEQSKFEYFVSVIGYLLHKYKDPKNTFAIILAEESENEADGGGTGKGLFVKAVQKLIPTVVFDGKQFNPAKSFAFQRVNLNTKLVAIEDARKGFNFESMYSFITEGLPIEKKNQKEFFLSFADAPKFTISTNYVINDEGNHAKRRQKVLEFSNYFSPSHTPYDEFNKMFFEGWEYEEWNRFYNFMFYCVGIYLGNGVLDNKQSNTNKLKNIKLKYSEDLLFFVNSLVENKMSWCPTSEVWTEFLNDNQLDKKEYSQKKFADGLDYISSQMGYKVERDQQRINGGKPKRVIKISKK